MTVPPLDHLRNPTRARLDEQEQIVAEIEHNHLVARIIAAAGLIPERFARYQVGKVAVYLPVSAPRIVSNGCGL